MRAIVPQRSLSRSVTTRRRWSPARRLYGNLPPADRPGSAMATRTDQLHSHQFMLQRVVGALAMRDPDPVSSPLRRIGGALLASVLVAALALAAVGVYGAAAPGGGTRLARRQRGHRREGDRGPVRLPRRRAATRCSTTPPRC